MSTGATCEQDRHSGEPPLMPASHSDILARISTPFSSGEKDLITLGLWEPGAALAAAAPLLSHIRQKWETIGGKSPMEPESFLSWLLLSVSPVVPYTYRRQRNTDQERGNWVLVSPLPFLTTCRGSPLGAPFPFLDAWLCSLEPSLCGCGSSRTKASSLVACLEAGF